VSLARTFTDVRAISVKDRCDHKPPPVLDGRYELDAGMEFQREYNLFDTKEHPMTETIQQTYGKVPGNKGPGFYEKQS
jgi:hypothetical protein